MNFFRKTALALLVVVVLCVTPVFGVSPDGSDGSVSSGSDAAAPAPVVDTPSSDVVSSDVSGDGSGSADSGGSDPVPDGSESDGDGSDPGSSGTGGIAGSYSVTCSGADVSLEVTLDDRESFQVVSADGSGDSSLYSVGDSSEASDVGSYASLSDVLVAIFGEYTPRTQTVSTYFDGELIATSTEYVPGVAGLDFEWLAGVCLFALVLYSLFRLFGGVFR